MTTDQVIPKTQNELLQHAAGKGRLTFVLGPFCYGKARTGHVAYRAAVAHLPKFVTDRRFVVIDAPADSSVDLTRRQVVTSGAPVRILGEFVQRCAAVRIIERAKQ